MTSWLFNTDEEGWEFTPVGPMSWDGAEGDPSPGCLSKAIADASDAAESWRDSLSITVAIGDNFSFHQRHVWTAENDNFDLTVIGYVTIDAVEYTVISEAYPITVGAGDGGWVLLTGTMPVAGTLSKIRIRQSCPFLLSLGMTVYFDSVYAVDVDPDAPAAAALPETRYLGMAADFGSLYLTTCTGGTLQILTMLLGDPLTPSGTSTFGTVTFADVDAGLNGLYPVVRPTVDGVVYVYGRDGNNKQVWYKDGAGTLGFVDIGPGTATWGTAKIAVALMPGVFYPTDVMVAFSDNDVYQTALGTAPWVKNGDATTGLRTAARTLPDDHQLLLAGTAAGTMLYSQNYGVTYTSGGTAAGTINAIEVSR